MMRDIFLKNPFTKRPLTRSALAKSYARYPSISEQLPWSEYDATHQCFFLNDGRSVAAIFELEDVATEVRPQSYLLQLQQGLQSLFQEVFPLYFDQECPWIVQFYLQDELNLEGFFKAYADYLPRALKDTVFTADYLNLFKSHLDFMVRPQGLFLDTKVSGHIFRGKLRKIRVVIYRPLRGLFKSRASMPAIHNLNAIAHAFSAKSYPQGIASSPG